MAQKLQFAYDGISGLKQVGNILVLLLLLPIGWWLSAEKRKGMSSNMKTLLTYLASFSFLWLLFGFGIPWYAFPVLALLPILAGYYLQHPEQFLSPANGKFSKYFLGGAIGFFLFLNLIQHFSDPEKGEDRSHLIFKSSFVKYASGTLDKEEALAQFNPFYAEALGYLNSDPTEKIYRVGTYMEYHILQNDQRVLEDNQLGRFDGIRKRLQNQNDFINVLRDNGFKYILYDLNSITIDQTPEQTLYQKNVDFLNIVVQPNEVEMVVTDRIVEDPNGAVIQFPAGAIQGKPALVGKVIYKGSFALFEII